MSSKNVFTTVENKVPSRNYFDLTHDVKFSARFGELIPVCCVEAIPGDRFKIGAEGLTRFQPLRTPAMHRFDWTIHYFFVPNRILWPNWEKFISPENGVATNAHPTLEIAMDSDSFPRLANFMGLPHSGTGTPGAPPMEVNALPFAAYQKIFSDYYRDQNLQTGFGKEFTELVDGLNSFIYLDMQYRAWEHDYFTSCLPFAQKGAPVEIPITGEVVLNPNLTGAAGKFVDPNTGIVTDIGDVLQSGVVPNGAVTINGNDQIYDPNGSLVIDGATSTINDLRRAYALQEWLEKNARGGTRYTESIRMHFGVTSSDARLQRAEYITGVKSPIIISEVLNTTGIDGELPQGNMAGHGVGTISGGGKSFFCEEHGWIMGIMSIMPKTAYMQGVHKKFLRRSTLDYPWPSFAHIGEQEVQRQEVYYNEIDGVNNGVNDDTFGYLPRYSEYRFEQNRVMTDLRDTLLDWHAGRKFATNPTLSEAFITTAGTAPETTDRLFAVSTDVADPLICVVLNKIHAVRPFPYFGTPTY